MEYDWDPEKAYLNRDKHGVSFADVPVVLEDEFARTIADEYTEEERYITIGMDAFGRILVVVYTWRGDDRIRIISARSATRQERRLYTEGIDI